MQRKFMFGKKTRASVLFILPFACFILSCTRQEIDFGTIPENSYTHLLYIDTVGVQFSTVIIDSFSTSSATSYLVGKYQDQYLGIIKTQPFFQLDKPASIPEISVDAVYDSLSCILLTNKYYYGDTTKSETINVHELAKDIVLGYNDQMFNTNVVDVKPVPLGSRTRTIRPSVDDSIYIRLDDAKGKELFLKLRDQTNEVSSTDAFRSYFKGMSLTTDDNDTSVVYGIKDTVVMRVHYHVNDPFPTSKTIDFISIANTESFNHIESERPGTGLVKSNRGYTEILSAQSNHLSYSQPGTGLYLKMIFPGLRGVLLNENIVRLLKAELILRPLRQSFDINNGNIKLPLQLFLVNTDATNIPGYVVTASGGGALYADPVIDKIYNEDSYYSFDVTSPVNTLLNTGGTESSGFYAIQGHAGSIMQLDRIVAGDKTIPGYTTQLKLSVLVINK
jgi:hypothetical protein